MVLTKYINHVIGTIEITTSGDLITGISFIEGKRAAPSSDILILKEIEEYFSGKLKRFDSKTYQKGTAFQQKVWNALLQIPYGETRTYGEIAQMIGSLGSSRAVGTACGKNSLPLIIPCHRVISSNGLGGFSAGIERKKFLLELEQSHL